MSFELIPLILMVAVFIEGFVEWIKKDYRKKPSVWVALALGLVAAIAIGFNPLAMFDVMGPVPQLSTIFGYFMGGVILSRGSNYVNDFISGWKSTNPEKINGVRAPNDSIAYPSTASK